MTLAELIADGHFSRDPALVWAAKALVALRAAQEVLYPVSFPAADEVLRATEEEV